MKKIAPITLALTFIFVSPALGQEVDTPADRETTRGPVQYQYDGGDATTQSIEDGLEDAAEDVEDVEKGDAVGGTGAYVDSLGGEEEAAAATPETTAPQPPKPSEAYTELPDTGGVSPVPALALAGSAVVVGGMLARRGRSRS